MYYLFKDQKHPSFALNVHINIKIHMYGLMSASCCKNYCAPSFASSGELKDKDDKHWETNLQCSSVSFSPASPWTAPPTGESSVPAACYPAAPVSVGRSAFHRQGKLLKRSNRRNIICVASSDDSNSWNIENIIHKMWTGVFTVRAPSHISLLNLVIQ